MACEVGGLLSFSRGLLGVGILAVAGVAGASAVLANEPDVAPGIVLHMQTAFNPNLPGAGEAVRTFTKTLKHMAGGALAVKVIEPGRMAPTRDMLDAVVSGDLEAAFTWSGYAAVKSPVFGLFGTLPFGPNAEEMTSWILDGDGGKIHRDAYDKLGVACIPCGVQGAKGGGWFRADLDTPEDFKGVKLRYGKIAGPVIA